MALTEIDMGLLVRAVESLTLALEAVPAVGSAVLASLPEVAPMWTSVVWHSIGRALVPTRAGLTSCDAQA